MKAKILFFALAVTGLFVSCNEYFDDLQPLGKRVEVLEDSVLSLNNKAQSLQLIIKAMETNGYITRIEDNDDGSYTIYMMGDFDGSGKLTEKTVILAGGSNGADGADGADGRNGVDGTDGKGLGELLKVQKGAGGQLYWIFNGEPLLDEEGNPIPVNGPNGKKGVQGDKGDEGASLNSDAVMPQVRIGVKRTWEISTDGGKSWKDTGVGADGEKGDKGEQGDKGQAATIDILIRISDDGTKVIFYVIYADDERVETYVVPRNSIN